MGSRFTNTPLTGRLAAPALGCIALAGSLCSSSALAAGEPGWRLLGFTNFASFDARVDASGKVQLDSPVLDPGLDWDEAVFSWNAELGTTARLEIQARVLGAGRSTDFYSLGRWTRHPGPARGSVVDQQDAEAEVLTDILRLRVPARSLQIRCLQEPGDGDASHLKFLAVALVSPGFPSRSRTGSVASAIGPLPVPQRCQLDFSSGDAWCSPTCVSMVLAYWADRVDRPELAIDGEDVAMGVDDPNWPGTGNWSFNMAYVGSLPGVRAQVARLGGVEDLEAWLRLGVPVAASVAYGVLKTGTREEDDGHLVVVTGIMTDGAVVLNDPGSRLEPTRMVARDRFAAAWAASRNTVYVIHPAGLPVPGELLERWWIR